MSNAIAYMDDIVVFSNSEFWCDRLSQFRGGLVTVNCIKPLPSIVEAIQKYPIPKDV